MTYEDQVRRQMEEAAKAQANGSAECPVEEDVDVAFGFRQAKKALKKATGVGISRMTSRSGKTHKRKGAEPEIFMHKGKRHVGKTSDG